MNCPKCKSQLRKEDINVSTDLAMCANCGHIAKLSELVITQLGEDPDFDIHNTPKGTWVKESADNVKIGATTRSPFAFFIIPFMIVWSGFSIGGLYGSQIYSGKFDLAQSLFGIPFILGSILFWGLGLMMVFGKNEITLTKAGGTIFTGMGAFGIRKRFNWTDIQTVRESLSYARRGGNQVQITLEGSKRITFGMFLNSARRYFVMQAFRYYQNKLGPN
jgi:hypothetical protein